MTDTLTLSADFVDSDIDISDGEINISLDVTGGGGGVKLPINYENDKHIINRPQINNIELIGNKTGDDLRLQDKMQALSVSDIEKILYLG